ncbi:hypothetical protein OSB04_014410 [Centaurea solstitialis]|uniref:2-oxoglutarate-dependent dioxygenase n=1 Tax=Centaurea solstitialis TaxID=347529 RepID=A0AA38SX14_9ASTR|nr:hypothetical protein OSB04_014410 [Centaurea solstitialis]
MASLLPSIPVINMDDLKPGTESWISTSQKVTHALEEYGCFMAVYESVSKELRNDVLDSLKSLFNLPKEAKIKNTSDKPFHGYMGPIPIRPLYESMGIDHPTSLDDVQNFSNLMWPSGNDHFSNHLSSAPKADETNLGAEIHTDKSFITILGQINPVNGLQVEIKDGKWVDVEILPSSFVVLATDPFMAWSNGRVKPPCHRVIMDGEEDRHSTVLFSYKKGIIETPEELVDEEHRSKFKPFDHYKFLEFFSKDEIYLDEKAIKLFCGA